MLILRRPAAIFTTGGYVALPVLLAASVLRIPVVMWDGNVVPGRSVRVTARLAGCLAVAFEGTCRALGRAATVLRHGHADPRPARRRPGRGREGGSGHPGRRTGCS